jgi:hypothetical protein
MKTISYPTTQLKKSHQVKTICAEDPFISVENNHDFHQEQSKQRLISSFKIFSPFVWLF